MERLIKEAPKTLFNPNVFKSGIKLALSPAEIQKEEDQVELLAKFLKDEALASVCKEMKVGENVPTDSLSMHELLHKQGVNMRYLGQLHKLLQSPEGEAKSEGDAQQNEKRTRGENRLLLTLVEREIVLRSTKHVLNGILKDQTGDSTLHMAHAVAHILNCLFSP